MKTCGTDEGSAAKVNADVDTRPEAGKLCLYDHKMIKTSVVSAVLAGLG